MYTHTHTHTQIQMHKSYNDMAVGEKKITQSSWNCMSRRIYQIHHKGVVVRGIYRFVCVCMCVCVGVSLCIQIFQRTSKSPSSNCHAPFLIVFCFWYRPGSPSALHCYTPSALRLTPYAFSDCILFLRVYTAPDIRQFRIVIRHVCWRMLTYADVCWRLQTRISVSFALSYAFLLAASVNTNQHKNKHLRSVCQQVGIRQSVSASRHKPQLTPTSTRISTLGLCVSK
jgi:hypothetical protein